LITTKNPTYGSRLEEEPSSGFSTSTMAGLCMFYRERGKKRWRREKIFKISGQKKVFFMN